MEQLSRIVEEAIKQKLEYDKLVSRLFFLGGLIVFLIMITLLLLINI